MNLYTIIYYSSIYYQYVSTYLLGEHISLIIDQLKNNTINYSCFVFHYIIVLSQLLLHNNIYTM